jgi:endogenous inhibitor of DNA gyrase (YacG/DUF329 family)
MQIERPCRLCGKEFTGQHAGKIFCSDKCAKEYSLIQRLEWQKQQRNVLTRWNKSSPEYELLIKIAVKNYKSPGHIVKMITNKYLREKIKQQKQKQHAT